MKFGWMGIKLSGMGRGCRLAVLALGLAACGVPPPAPVRPGPPVPQDFPAALYRQAREQGRTVLQVDGPHSLVTIAVHRAGSLARLGHDHMVASHDLRGFVAPEEGRADLWFALADLVVDEAELRAAAGFDTHPSREAIEGTRRNMLDKVLEAERFPFVLLAARRLDAGHLRLAITLHGVTRERDIPVHIETRPDGLAASGQMTIDQSDFGIAPMAVLGGALRVADRLDLSFRIVAKSP